MSYIEREAYVNSGSVCGYEEGDVRLVGAYNSVSDTVMLTRQSPERPDKPDVLYLSRDEWRELQRLVDESIAVKPPHDTLRGQVWQALQDYMANRLPAGPPRQPDLEDVTARLKIIVQRLCHHLGLDYEEMLRQHVARPGAGAAGPGAPGLS